MTLSKKSKNSIFGQFLKKDGWGGGGGPKMICLFGFSKISYGFFVLAL
jgi:hypothetical protein